jgi:hypothetical protein
MSNSRCTLNMAAVAASAVGNSVTVNLPLTFTTGYGGAKNVYAMAYDIFGQNSGWHSLGSWTVPGGGPPSMVSVAPVSGSGMSQTFAFTASAPGGAATLNDIYVVVESGLTGVNSCYIEYNSLANTVRLAANSGISWPAPAAVGSSTPMSNSQCTLNTAAVTASAVGNSVTVNLPLTFTAGYSGAKNLYAMA